MYYINVRTNIVHTFMSVCVFIVQRKGAATLCFTFSKCVLILFAL